MSAEKEKRWTLAQQSAIEHKGGDLLVSAAAGSGKTATLTERLVRLLCSPEEDVLPSEILAVTFTGAASDEMRSRLYDAAMKEVSRNPGNKKARRLLSSIDTVQICTMHSFCYSTIRPHFATLGLASDFRVADAAESEILRRGAMSETVTKFFDSQLSDERFAELCDVLSNARDETSMDKTLLDLAQKLSDRDIGGAELEKYAEKLEEAANEDFFLSEMSLPLRQRIADFASHYRGIFEYYLRYLSENEYLLKAYYPECEHICDFCTALLSAAENQSYQSAGNLMTSFAFGKLGPVKTERQTDESLEFKEYREVFKKALNRISPDLIFPTEEITRSLIRTADVERTLGVVISDFEERFAAKKRERGVVDFSDLESLTRRLLVDGEGNPTPEAKRISSRYKYVFIDEYQDTNRTQDDIFRAVSLGAKRFIVGDIKQSIYGFRGAQPDVFSDMRRSFTSDPEKGSYIFMSENFRSAKNVLDFANTVSDRMFLCSPIPYDSSDRLRFARPGADCPAFGELVLIPTREDEDEFAEDETDEGDELISEADYVAKRIYNIIKTEKKPDGSPILPGDCAILLRSPNKKGDEYAAALAKLGIRSNKNAKTRVFFDKVSLALLCIMNAVVNPELDIYLTGAMKTGAFGFSLEDTVKIRLAYGDMPMISSVKAFAGGEDALSVRCAEFIKKLDELRRLSTLLPADAFLRTLVRSLKLDQTLAEEGITASEVRKKLHEMRDMAKSAENSGFSTPADFLRYAERMMENDTSSQVAPEPSDDAVSIMSIHHSKGLEFPVCFLPCASSPFNLKDSSANLLVDPDIGIACRLPDESTLVRCDTVLRRCAAAAINSRAIDEEMRVLYVAMTRPRDRLIVTASVKSPENEIRSTRAGLRFDSKYSVLSAGCYLKWILPSLLAEETPFAEITVPGEEYFNDFLPETSEEAQVQNPSREENPEELLSRRFDFVYPYSHLEKIPAKLTVSKLYPAVLDEEMLSAEIFEADLDRELSLPNFMKKETAPSPAEIGTATHVFMQFCDFELLFARGVDAELERLLSQGFMPPRYAHLVDKAQLETFRQSEFFERIRRSKRIFREFRFNSSRPASRFTSDPDFGKKLEESGADVIVQGVVDLLIEDEDSKLVLADYKTDRFTAEQKKNIPLCENILRERHFTQLSYYREICGEMMKRPMDECLIYSMALGKCVRL